MATIIGDLDCGMVIEISTMELESLNRIGRLEIVYDKNKPPIILTEEP